MLMIGRQSYTFVDLGNASPTGVTFSLAALAVRARRPAASLAAPRPLLAGLAGGPFPRFEPAADAAADLLGLRDARARLDGAQPVHQIGLERERAALLHGSLPRTAPRRTAAGPRRRRRDRRGVGVRRRLLRGRRGPR